ncbi:MAG TPA: hypothetical protein VF552_09215 [Allosphingosinicella sp.]
MSGVPASAAPVAAAPGAAPSAPHAAGSPFNTRTVAALVAAGIVAFALFLLLSAYAGDMRGGGSDPRSHALSKSAVGFHGLVRLVELSGGRSRIVRDQAGLATPDLLVVMAEEQTDPQRLAQLLERRAELPTLVILPKWRVRRDPVRQGRVLAMGQLDGREVRRLLGDENPVDIATIPGSGGALRGESFLEGVDAPAPEQVQVATGDRLVPLLGSGTGGALSQMDESPHYLLAEPDLMNNHGLADPKRARAALDILNLLNDGKAPGGVAFDLTLNGLGAGRNPLRLAFEPPFLPLTLALALAALLAGLHGAFRFGAPAQGGRAIAFGKSQLVENSAGLFKLARREHRAGGAYAELIRETAAHDSGAHMALRDAELDAYLDRVSPPGAPTFSELAARARAAADPSQLIAAARALFQWKKDLIK